MKYLILVATFFIFILRNSESSEYDCVEKYLNKSIIFAFNDGDTHQMTIKKNVYDVYTANYSRLNDSRIMQNTDSFTIGHLKIKCLNLTNQIYFYKNKISPIGTYRHSVKIKIPFNIVNGQSEALVDLRYGRFYNPYPKIFIENFIF